MTDCWTWMVLGLALARPYAPDFTSSAASPGYRVESVGTLGSSLVGAHPHCPPLPQAKPVHPGHGDEDCLQEEFSADQDKGAAYTLTPSVPSSPLSVVFTKILLFVACLSSGDMLGISVIQCSGLVFIVGDALFSAGGELFFFRAVGLMIISMSESESSATLGLLLSGVVTSLVSGCSGVSSVNLSTAMSFWIGMLVRDTLL